MKLFRNRGRHRHPSFHQLHRKHKNCEQCPSRAGCLAEVPPGCQARVIGFSDHLRPDRFAHLQAYGVIPGHWVQVVQHTPVMIIRIDHTEIALEIEMAREVKVEKIKVL
jgi:Fe2+ transport system protein FeoA